MMLFLDNQRTLMARKRAKDGEKLQKKKMAL